MTMSIIIKRFVIAIIVFSAVTFLRLTDTSGIEGDSEMTENLLIKCNLKKINRITIRTEDFALSYVTPINKEITDKDTITNIINSLKRVKVVPVCDTRPQYTITFYRGVKEIANLGFFIDNNWYFLRLDSKSGQEDYEPNNSFIEIWKEIQYKYRE